MPATIRLPRADGTLAPYTLRDPVAWPVPTAPIRSRVAYAAAHVVRDPLAEGDPLSEAALDWDATLAYRRYLWIACGAGTDQLAGDRVTLEDVQHAYEEQVDWVERHGGRVILMASRALARLARGPDDYSKIYGAVLEQLRQPAILHWLGEMFDPELAGYWGSRDVGQAMQVCLGIIAEHRAKVEGIKISLLDPEREVAMRAQLPAGVRMYTGDDLNFDRLILGDGRAHSDALLGIFDAIAPAASAALQALDRGDTPGYRAALAPTMALARHIFQRPTHAYKTGIVFLAYLNGHQTHFRMLGGAESWRSVPHVVELFRLADCAGLLADPERAAERMERVLQLAGVE